MKCIVLSLAAPAAAALIPHIPSVGEYVAAVDSWLRGPYESGAVDSCLTVSQRYLDHVGGWGGFCTLKASPEGQDDTDNIEATFKRCGRNSIVMLPSERYNITRPLTVTLDNTIVELGGLLTFSDHNIDDWIRDSYDLEFQHQKLAFVIEGNNFVINGGKEKKGGIDGNGQAWYDYAAGVGNKHGRPISLALRNVRNAVISDFRIIQPQFWAHVVIDSANVAYTGCTVNATNYNPDAKYEDKSWLQNTDGIDTYRSTNVAITDFVYQGGDDCIALKPNSTNIAIDNVTCIGGTGIAFGSIAQYPGVTDTIRNVAVNDVRLYGSNQCPGYQGVYFKSWVGVESGEPPNGGGGGTGLARNISVSNIYMEDIWHPIALTSSLTYLDGEHGKNKDTGTFKWSHVNITNISGTSKGNRVVWMDCSAAEPCTHFNFTNIDVVPGKKDNQEIAYVCNNMKHIVGNLRDCHPNNSTDETDSGGTI